MSYLHGDAEQSVQAVNAFQSWHSKMTWNAGQPGIEPWLRDTLVSLQNTLNTVAQTQLKIADQVDENARLLAQIAHHLNKG